MYSKKNIKTTLIKKILTLLRKNYIIAIFIACILFVGVVSFSRLFLATPTYLYVKVKVGQGYWWAATQKPPIWLVDSLKKGDKAKDISGEIKAEVLSKRYYRYFGSGQYDVYLTLRIRVGENKKTGEYVFDRSTISVGSPIDIQFPNAQVTGTVIKLSREQFEDKLIEKTVYLSKRGAFPWELSSINIGDALFDGEENIFEVIDKSGIETTAITWDAFGNNTPNITENSKYVTVKARVKLRKVNSQWVFGEDTQIVPGDVINVSTPNFTFSGYYVSRLE